MPLYKYISKETQKLWYVQLKINIRNISTMPDNLKFLYFLVSLYEYIQVFSNLSLNNKDEDFNVKVTIKDIKLYINDISLATIINRLKTIRDSYIEYVSDENLIRLLKMLNFDNEFINYFNLTVYRLKNKESYTISCLDECKELFKVVDSESIYTVKEVYNILSSKYDEETVLRTILNVLANQKVV
jgi:hypothetical protein